METTGFALNITSRDPARLFRFYRDVVGLPPDEEFNRRFGESALRVNGQSIIIDEHSATPDKSRDPTRFLLDFVVANLVAEKVRLETLGVVFIRQPEREFWGGLITTFLDPDGNYVQLMEMPSEG